MKLELLRRWALLLFAAALLVAAGISVSNTRVFLRSASASEGIVVQTPFGGSHPEIEFLDRTGQKFSYPQHGLVFGYRQGDQVHVLYNPANPVGTASIDTFGALWMWAILLGGLGVFNLLLLCLNVAGLVKFRFTRH